MAVFVTLAHFSKGDSMLQSGICPICGKVPFNSEPACFVTLTHCMRLTLLRMCYSFVLQTQLEPLAKPFSVAYEKPWQWSRYQSDEGQQAIAPAEPDIVVHFEGDQRNDGTEDASRKVVRTDGGCCMPCPNVDQIDRYRHDECHNTYSKDCSSGDWNYPVYVLLYGPPIPYETDAYQWTAKDYRFQADLRFESSIFGGLFHGFVARHRKQVESNQIPDTDPDVNKAGRTFGEPVSLLENGCHCREEEEQISDDESQRQTG
jgi:hypothetical protein